jgi:DNA-binding MarR family transcriptional regulator
MTMTTRTSSAGALGYALRYAHLASVQHFARAVTRDEISPLQFSILLCVYQQPGINPAEISKVTAV